MTSSSRAVDVDAAAEILGLGHDLGLLRQPPHRRERGAGDERAQQRRRADAAERDEEQDQAHAVEEVVDLAQGPHQLQRVAPAERHRQHSHVRAVDGGVREELARSPRAAAVVASGTGNSTFWNSGSATSPSALTACTRTSLPGSKPSGPAPGAQPRARPAGAL